MTVQFSLPYVYHAKTHRTPPHLLIQSGNPNASRKSHSVCRHGNPCRVGGFPPPRPLLCVSATSPVVQSSANARCGTTLRWLRNSAVFQTLGMNDSFDTEHFIEMIRERPAIWDVQAEDYSDKIKKQQCWNEVFVEMVRGFNKLSNEEKKRKSKEILRRWKSLRNCFTRELAKQKQSNSGEGASSRKTYIYFEMLSFLNPTSQNKSTNSSWEPEVVCQESENFTPEFMSLRDRGQKRKRKLEDPEDNESTPVRSSSENDDDKLFLISLHTHLKSIPDHLKLLAKAELIQVLAKFNDPQQFGTNRHNNYTSPYPASSLSPHYPPQSQNQYFKTNIPNHYPMYHSAPFATEQSTSALVYPLSKSI